MKPLSFSVMLVFSLCSALCSTEEDTPSEQFFIENNNLIRIVNNTDTFNLNDVITIETVIDNNQTTVNNEDILLSNLFYDDILYTSFLQHNLVLYKETGFRTLSPITVTLDDIENIEGLTEVNGNFMQIRSYYDSNTNTFISEFSITLKESGTFFISDNRFGLNDYRGIFITGGVLELGFAQIKSAIQNANEDGGYRFTVN